MMQCICLVIYYGVIILSKRSVEPLRWIFYDFEDVVIKGLFYVGVMILFSAMLTDTVSVSILGVDIEYIKYLMYTTTATLTISTVIILGYLIYSAIFHYSVVKEVVSEVKEMKKLDKVFSKHLDEFTRIHTKKYPLSIFERKRLLKKYSTLCMNAETPSAYYEIIDVLINKINELKMCDNKKEMFLNGL